MSKYTSGGNDIAGIRNIWGGTDSSSDVASSDINDQSGQFGGYVAVAVLPEQSLELLK